MTINRGIMQHKLLLMYTGILRQKNTHHFTKCFLLHLTILWYCEKAKVQKVKGAVTLSRCVFRIKRAWLHEIIRKMRSTCKQRGNLSADTTRQLQCAYKPTGPLLCGRRELFRFQGFSLNFTGLNLQRKVMLVQPVAKLITIIENSKSNATSGSFLWH